MSLFSELNRRNVFRVGAAYIVAAWLIIQVAETIFPLFGFGDGPARLVVIVLAIGFVPVLIFSWAFEWTPHGFKRDGDVDLEHSVTPKTGKKLDGIIMLVLALALGYFAFDKFVLDPQRDADITETAIEIGAEQAREEARLDMFNDKSVAVLPFVNRSERKEDEYFADGMHDELLTLLSRIAALKVISRTSVMRYRGTLKSIPEIASDLSVATIVEGGVQRSGDHVRVNVQLIDAHTDEHLWADTYDRELTTGNIFSIQSEISTAIAEALKATLSPEEKQQLSTVSTENLTALEAFFLGRQAMAKRTSASLAVAEQQFKHAIELDPDYAQACVGLAETYLLQASYSGRSNPDAISLMEPLIEKAISLNDGLGEAYISKASMVADNDDRTTTEALFKKGIALAPGYASGYKWYSQFLGDQGRLKEALVQIGEAARLDPLSGIVRVNLGESLANLGRFDEAGAQYEFVIRIDPDFAVAYWALGLLDWTVNGRLDNAIVRLRQAAKLDPGYRAYFAQLARLWLELGGAAEAERSHGIARSIGSDETADFWPISVSFRSGEFAEAQGAAEAVLAQRPANRAALLILGLNDLRADRVDLAIARYRAAYPELLDDANPDIDASNYWIANDIVYLLQKTGDFARATMLLDRNMAFIQTIQRLGNNGYGIEDARIHMLQGRTDLALAAIGEAVDSGWRTSWRFYLKHDAVLEPLHSEPEYQAIIAEVEADMAAQLVRVREMEANGELPPIPE